MYISSGGNTSRRVEDSIVTSPIDLDSMTGRFVSSSHAFFATRQRRCERRTSAHRGRFKTLRAAHDPKISRSTGSVNLRSRIARI